MVMQVIVVMQVMVVIMVMWVKEVMVVPCYIIILQVNEKII